jgi:BirA family biotin operon repressor/biotin-[acetyl-CoA-carboxylase] ligase
VPTSDDRIDPVAVHGRLLDRGISWPVPQVVPSTDSTNADVLARAADGAPVGTCVVADEQTAGRGRLGRAWVSDPGAGLWCSTLIPYPGAHLPLLAGTVVAHAVRSTGLAARLKWPNDVIVDDPAAPGKIAGILVEADGSGRAVVGIGVNVWRVPADVPGAQSLAGAGHPTRREDLLVGILAGLHAGLAREPAEVLADYRTLCATVGREVRVVLPTGEELVGEAVGIADDGRLGVHVTGPDGRGNTRYLAAGDVVHATI